MTTATPPQPSPPITAADLLAAAWRHRLTLTRGCTALDIGSRCCCGIGAAAVLFEPELARHGDPHQARRVVQDRIGVDGIEGLENGFEGWKVSDTTYSDPAEFYRWRAVGEALAREAGVVPGEDGT